MVFGFFPKADTNIFIIIIITPNSADFQHRLIPQQRDRVIIPQKPQFQNKPKTHLHKYRRGRCNIIYNTFKHNAMSVYNTSSYKKNLQRTGSYLGMVFYADSYFRWGFAFIFWMIVELPRAIRWHSMNAWHLFGIQYQKP